MMHGLSDSGRGRWRMTLRTGMFGTVLVALAAFVGCGSDGGPSRPRMMESGYVYIRNDSSETLEVEYLNDETRETVGTEVPAFAQQTNVSQVKLEGGSEVTFLITRVDGGRYEVEVEIDGNRTVWIKEISTQGSRGGSVFDYVIIATPEI